MILGQFFLRDERVRLAVTEVSRRRANQLRDFVRVLKLGAVNLNNSARIAEKNFGGGFHDARLSGTGRAQEKEVTHRASRRIHSGRENLIEVGDGADGFFLSDNPCAQRGIKFLRFQTAKLRIEYLCAAGHMVTLSSEDSVRPADREIWLLEIDPISRRRSTEAIEAVKVFLP